LQAQLVLLSGLFFQGKWKNVFNKTFTKTEPFHDTNGNKIGEVNMMFQRGPFAYAAVKDLGCHVIELPYANSAKPKTDSQPSIDDRLVMILVLPKKGLTLVEAIGNVYNHGMDKIFDELRESAVEYEDDEVEVHIPRFETASSLDLKETLQRVSSLCFTRSSKLLMLIISDGNRKNV